MLIEDLAIQRSAAVAYRNGSTTTPLTNQKDTIAALHDALTSCGWAATGLFPAGSITYFLGVPTVDGGTSSKVYVGDNPFVTLGSAQYTLYDAGRAIPLPGASSTFVAMGTTPAHTLDNLCAAMTTGVWLATWRTRTGGGYVLDVLCLVAGSQFNYTFFLADGGWGVATEISGGGWIFTSVADSRTSQYTVKATAQGQINPITRRTTKPIILDFETSFNGYGAATLYLDADGIVPAPGYQIVANPYSFAIWKNGQTSILAAAPYIPPGWTAAYAVMAIYPTVFPALYWSNGATVWLDNAPQSYLSSNYPRVLATRSPGTTALKTPTGAPLITTSWVMLGKDYTTAPKVVGRLWDCAVVNDLVNGAVIDGQKYIAIAQQDGAGNGTRCSLVFRIDN